MTWLDTVFCQYGYPDRVRTDRGPQMRGKLEEFCRRAKIVLERSSAANPRSNGSAENAMKQVKQLYSKACQEGVSKEESLFFYLSTPRRAGSLSPARIFHNREI